jgi:8-oxo-dGTP pyrophosphatase MutT (NUDIX family)
MLSVKNPWKKLSSKIVYKNKYYKVREDEVIRPDNKKGKYFVIEQPPSVMIVPLTTNNEIYLVGLYRYTTNSFSWEIPGGACDNQKPITAAKRELKEETGLIAKKWELLGLHQPLNASNEKYIYTVLAQDVTQTGNNKQKEEGIVELKKVSFKKVLEMIKTGKILDGETTSSILLAGLKLGII